MFKVVEGNRRIRREIEDMKLLLEFRICNAVFKIKCVLDGMYIRIATTEENINEHKSIAIDYPKCRIEKKRRKP